MLDSKLVGKLYQEHGTVGATVKALQTLGIINPNTRKPWSYSGVARAIRFSPEGQQRVKLREKMERQQAEALARLTGETKPQKPPKKFPTSDPDPEAILAELFAMNGSPTATAQALNQRRITNPNTGGRWTRHAVSRVIAASENGRGS